MRLIDLEPEWVYDFNVASRGFRRADDSHTLLLSSARQNPGWPALARLDVVNAQGVMFLCPVCFVKNGGPVGTESVLCYFRGRGVPDDAVPGPGRWEAHGTGFDDLSLSPSVNVDNGHWHGFVTNGAIV